MGVNFKEETTAGLLAFCALEGVGSGPVGGEYKKTFSQFSFANIKPTLPTLS